MPEPDRAPLDPDGTVVVVGASLAGLRAAEEVRHLGHRGPVVVIGEEGRLPYDRPPLSKQVLAGAWEPTRIHHRAPDALDTLGLELRLGRRAESLDTGTRLVGCDDGTDVHYDGLVIASGAAARPLPSTGGLSRVQTLRTLDDCLAILEHLTAAGPAPRVVVVGAGFIGAEVAATCRTREATVTMVEALATPLGRALGDEMGAVLADLHRRHGVRLLTDVGVERVTAPGDGGGDSPGDGSGNGDAGSPVTVRLSDGTDLVADVVVVGIGVVPSTGWLEGSGLVLDDGLVCDDSLFAGDRVVAAGDVARWTHPLLDEQVRLEHWTNAAEGGAAAGRNLLAGREAAKAYVPVPFFWSDQYTSKIQMIGVPGPGDVVAVVEGPDEEGRLVALYRRDDRLRAVLAVSRPRHLMAYRPLLAAGASFDEALAVSRA